LVGSGFATLGASAGFDGEIVRLIGAASLALIGLTLLVTPAQIIMARAVAPIAGWASERQVGMERYGFAGQAGIGALLGLVWSPCIGPTLGAATVLATRGESLGAVVSVMLAFGLGIASVLLLVALAGRELLTRWRGKLLSVGSGGKALLGGLLLGVGILIGTGLDRRLEAAILSVSPDWLIAVSTSI
jgi:cytochrome c biogenesis protein CcdA